MGGRSSPMHGGAVTLGDRPEERWPQAAPSSTATATPRRSTTWSPCPNALSPETKLVSPHANPGVMTETEYPPLAPPLQPVDGAHAGEHLPSADGAGHAPPDCPDKEPGLRVATIEAAGRASVPFTSGILVGIGERRDEVIDSLFALAGLQRRWGCIQEVIVQNFESQGRHPDAPECEPVPAWFALVVAVARWILGPEMNLQVPPTPHPEALRAVPRRRDKRLGWCLAAHPSTG